MSKLHANHTVDDSSISSSESKFEQMENGSHSLSILNLYNGDEEEEEKCLVAESLAKTDSTSAASSKVIVIVLLSINAMVIVVATYLFLLRQEEERFESSFAPIANKVVDELHYQTSNVVNTFHASSETLTSFWSATEATPPYAGMQDFETWGDNIRTQSKVEFVGLASLVTEKSSWEQYALENPWYIEGQHNMTFDELASARKGEGIAPKIYTYERYQGEVIPQPQQGPGPYAPLWQVNPYEHHKTMIKFDLLSHPTFQRMYETMVETRTPVASHIMELDYFLGDNTRQPRSVFFQPVYEKGGDETMTAILLGVIPWKTYLTGILDSEQEKIYVVLETNCDDGENVTFFLDGPSIVQVEPGRQLDGVEQVSITTNFDLLSFPHGNSSTSCTYRVRVIPTESLQHTYVSDQPMILSAVVAFMFFVTACAFMVYTTYIQNRQQKLLSIATHTSKIVSQLFPAKMRDRILKEAEDQALEAIIQNQQQRAHKGLRTGARSSVKSTASAYGTNLAIRIEEHLSNATGSNSQNTSFVQATRNHVASRPVAELFEDTTVFFGDLVGFTQWSANREPSDVFHLLEVLYGTFDIVASAHRVYKLETVGDCYVAVTGVPEANDKHALAMALFAYECMSVFPKIMERLAPSLGPETKTLNMRMGLHSGPVTGGVLRGERGRFQLFGDTMNTASRVESKGLPGRIHLSKETAELIKAAGKANWVVPREGGVEAKGKGILETFWFERASKSSDVSWSTVNTPSTTGASLP